MKDLLSLINVHKTYNLNERSAINKVSFNCSSGKMTAIIGSSGSGKTTLLRLIAGLEIPDGGKIILDGKIINSQSIFVPPEKRDCTLVFQDYALFPNMTVFENVSFGKTVKNNVKKIHELLDLAKINGLENRYPHEISGGQQQRVALVRALITNPSLLLLDEPLSHLDQELKDSVRVELSSLLKQKGMTSLFVSHDTEDALAMADEIIVLNNGKIDQIGNPMEIYSFPVNRYVALLFGKTNFIPRDLIPNSQHYFVDQDTNSKVIPVRPHQIIIVEKNSNINYPTLSGKIISSNAKGNHKEVKLKSNKLILTLNVPITSNINIGNELTVTFKDKIS